MRMQRTSASTHRVDARRNQQGNGTDRSPRCCKASTFRSRSAAPYCCAPRKPAQTTTDAEQQETWSRPQRCGEGRGGSGKRIRVTPQRRPTEDLSANCGIERLDQFTKIHRKAKKLLPGTNRSRKQNDISMFFFGFFVSVGASSCPSNGRAIEGG